jgi:transcriptional regulator with XRE-family HTH domain
MPGNIDSDSGGIREQRLAAGLSQLDVAAAAGCSVSMAALLDRGYRPRHSAVLHRIEAALDDLTQSNGAVGSDAAAKTAGAGGRHVGD